MRAKEFITESFNKCFDRACQLYDRASAQGVSATLLQIADYKGDGSSADNRWKQLPQRVWQHYVVVIGDTVYDPTATQFGADRPKQYSLDQLKSQWNKIYTIRSSKVNENFADNKLTSQNSNRRIKRDGIELEVTIDGQNVIIHSYADSSYSRQLGYVVFDRDGNTLVADDLAVDDRYHGQGIARVMYDYVKELGFTVKRSRDQTQAGKAFWDKNKGQDQTVWEHQG